MIDDIKSAASPSQVEGSTNPPFSESAERTKDSPAAPIDRGGPNPPVSVEEPSSPAKAEEITALNTRLSELEAFLSERDKEISSLKESLEQSKGVAAAFEATAKEREAALTKDHGQAISRILQAYRQSIMEANPDIPEELLSGSTIDEFQESLAKAKALVQKIRSQVSIPVAPAGAPVRSGPDLSGLSPREKIIHGLKR